MQRVQLSKKHQEKFFLQLQQSSNASWETLGKIFGVSGRTFRDWKRGKYTVPYVLLYKIHEKYKIPLPPFKRLLHEYWYIAKGARKGAQRRYELYGHVGTLEGRRKGGRISQQRRREDPEKYRALGCIVRKDFSPLRYTEELAEMVGIILGDGAITDTQVRISLDRIVDREYAFFVSRLMHRTFYERPSWTERENVITLTISGIGLVEALEDIGLQRGNKVVHQVGFPSWVNDHLVFQKACTRGLMDTDGGVYFHHHRTNGIRYRNFGLAFSNHSIPLVVGIAHLLEKLRFNFKVTKGKTRIYVYSLPEVQRYFQQIGTNNPKNIQKLRFHLQQSRRIR